MKNLKIATIAYAIGILIYFFMNIPTFVLPATAVYEMYDYFRVLGVLSALLLLLISLFFFITFYLYLMQIEKDKEKEK